MISRAATLSGSLNESGLIDITQTTTTNYYNYDHNNYYNYHY